MDVVRPSQGCSGSAGRCGDTEPDGVQELLPDRGCTDRARVRGGAVGVGSTSSVGREMGIHSNRRREGQGSGHMMFLVFLTEALAFFSIGLFVGGTLL